MRKHEEGREHGEDSGRVSSEGLCSDYSSLLPADSSGHKPRKHASSSMQRFPISLTKD